MPSAKILKRKQQVVSDLANELKDAQSIVLTDYQGLTVAQDTEMRSEFRKNNVQYRVVKNQIIKRAFETLGIEAPTDALTGPSALAFSKEDIVSAPRLSKKFAEKFKKTEIKGGVMEGQTVELATIMQLANIPDTHTLHGQLVGTLIHPVRKLAFVLNLVAKQGDEEGKEQVADLVKAVAQEVATEATTEAAESQEEAQADAE